MAALGARHLPVTSQRKAQFCSALKAVNGIFGAACRAVAIDPTVNQGKPAYSTWKKALRDDLDFAEQVADIMEEAAGAVEQEIMRRGEQGWLEPIYQKGARVYDTDADGKPVKASLRRFSDRLLLARARALMPGKYGDSSQHSVVHSGHVTHSSGLSMMDLRKMTPAERDQVEAAFQLLQRVQDGGQGGQAAIEHKPGQVLDADFEEVAEPVAVEVAEDETVKAEITEWNRCE